MAMANLSDFTLADLSDFTPVGRCMHPGCRMKAFMAGENGGPPLYCDEHMTGRGKISRSCSKNDCDNSAEYVFFNDGRLFCVCLEHANIHCVLRDVKRMCKVHLCITSGNFGEVGVVKRKYCALHAPDTVWKSESGVRCIFPGCDKKGEKIIYGKSRRVRCELHRYDDDRVFLTHRRSYRKMRSYNRRPVSGDMPNEKSDEKFGDRFSEKSDEKFGDRFSEKSDDSFCNSVPFAPGNFYSSDFPKNQTFTFDIARVFRPDPFYPVPGVPFFL